MFKKFSMVAAAALAMPLMLSGVESASAGPLPGRIAIAVNLDTSDTAAAARTWRFNVVDGTGHVVRTVSLPLSGELPSAAAAIDDLPAGDYEVHPVLSADLGTACSGPANFAIRAGDTAGTLGTTSASFTITPCTAAMRAMVPAIANDVIIDEPSTSQVTGTGDSSSTAPIALTLLVGLGIVATALAAVRTGVLAPVLARKR